MSRTSCARVEPERGRRLVLSVGDRLDAAADDLGDVARGVQRQADQDGEKLRRHRAAADDGDLGLLRNVERRRRSAGEPADERRRATKSASAGRITGSARPVASSGAARTSPSPTPPAQPASTPAASQTWPIAQNGIGILQAVLAEEDVRQRLQRLVDRRQELGQHEVPDEELQQQRHVAERLDVHAAERAQQEVARQPPDPDQRADDRGQHDADDRHAQRVRQPDQEGPGVGLRRIELEQALADREARRLQQEVEAALDAAHPHVLQRVVDEVPAGRHDQQHGDDLVDEAPERRAAPGPAEVSWTERP